MLSSQGYCTAVGVIVPIPFYLQEWLRIPTWGKSVDSGAALMKIFRSVEVSDRDRAFLKDMMSGHNDWLTTGAGSLHDLVDLTSLVLDKVVEVSQSLSFSFSYS